MSTTILIHPYSGCSIGCIVIISVYVLNRGYSFLLCVNIYIYCVCVGMSTSFLCEEDIRLTVSSLTFMFYHFYL